MIGKCEEGQGGGQEMQGSRNVILQDASEDEFQRCFCINI